VKQRIVLATDSADPSGMGEHMLTLGVGLAKEFDVLVAAPDGPLGGLFLRQAAQRGLRIKTIEPSRSNRFRRWLQSYGADLVHVHAGIGWEGHGLVRAARAAGVPVLRTEHLPDLLTSIVQRSEYRAMLLSVDRRIAVSHTVAASYNSGGGRLDIVPNGITPKAPSRTREEVRAALGVSPDQKLLLTIARFTAQKGYDVLVDAVPAVVAALPGAKFVLVGDGPEQGAISTAVAAAHLQDSVMLLGPRSDVPDLLAAADLFVLPSHFEGLPLALLEAMAAQVPVVATAIGGVIEALGKEHAHLVPPGDTQALAAAIIAALSDAAARAALAQAARERFSELFLADRMTAQTAQIYRSVLAEQTSKVPVYA
jgi:glycosyltransferase involved in cell wall biosynthesis